MSEKSIDLLNSITGWTANGTQTVEIQTFDDFISGYNTESLMIRISSGNSGKHVIKSFTTVDVTGNREITFSAVSLRRTAKYQVEIETGQIFTIEIGQHFGPVSIPVDGFNTVSMIRIISLDNVEDVIIISNLRVIKDSFPVDILNGIKSGLEVERDRTVSKGRKIGKITALAGDKFVVVENDWSWIEKSVVLTIGNERHQINNVKDNRASFMDNLDGGCLLNDYSNEDVYVSFPVEVGYYDREVQLPGIAIWYTSPTPATRNGRTSTEEICTGPLGTYRRRDGMIMTWRVQLEIAGRSPELVADATSVVRCFINKSTVWVHGKKLWFEWSEPAVDNEPIEGYDIIPRASYVFDVEIREDLWTLIKSPLGNSTLLVRPVL